MLKDYWKNCSALPESSMSLWKSEAWLYEMDPGFLAKGLDQNSIEFTSTADV